MPSLFADEEHAVLQASQYNTVTNYCIRCQTSEKLVLTATENTVNLHSENWKWTWLQIFPSPSPSPANIDLSPDSSTTSLIIIKSSEEDYRGCLLFHLMFNGDADDGEKDNEDHDEDDAHEDADDWQDDRCNSKLASILRWTGRLALRDHYNIYPSVKSGDPFSYRLR